MNAYKKNVTVVLDFLKERGYSQSTIQCHKKFYESLSGYLLQTGQHYSLELGKMLLQNNQKSAWLSKNVFLNSACIAKLNDVYQFGYICKAQVSPHKSYSSLKLSCQYQEIITVFISECAARFTETQRENIRRRCVLFLKYLQLQGITSLSEINYGVLSSYHDELSHLKKISRDIEESSICLFLEYLVEAGLVRYGLQLYMYALETGHLVTLNDLSVDEEARIETFREESLSFPADDFRSKTLKLMELHANAGYVASYTESTKRMLLQLFLFLDLNGLGYHPEIAEAWLDSDAVRKKFGTSAYHAARRILFVFNQSGTSESIDFGQTFQRGIRSLGELPAWCTEPLADFAQSRRKEKLDEDTVKNDIYSILRFCRFLVQKGFSSYTEVSGETVAEFNLRDSHASTKAKNACNGRIRRFLRYLYRSSVVSSPSLHLALGYTAAPVKTVVTILNEAEKETIREFMKNAHTRCEIRDSAILLLGIEMGMRGCDIVRLRLSDIRWKERCIHFCQDKTDADAWLSMPVPVGNALFRYLKEARPKNAPNDYVFVDFDAPFRKLTRNACYSAFHRVLPERKVPGSGFHVTRKTFATHLLRSGVHPAQIADAMGHQGMESITTYLSLNDRRMKQCPLSLAELGILTEGGAL